MPGQAEETDNEYGRGLLVSGVHKQYLPPPIFYETYIPILMEFQTRDWNKSEVTFNNWYNCVTETAPYKYSCPVVFHMNRAIVNLHVDFENVEALVEEAKLEGNSPFYQQKAFYEYLIAHSDFCDQIKSHFSSIYMHSQNYEMYIKAMKNCNYGSGISTVFDKKNTKYTYQIRVPFTKMENNFYNTFYKNIYNATDDDDTSDLIASALLSNSRTTLQGVILNVYYAEKYRWVHAAQSCALGRIPHSLIPRSTLNSTLLDLLRQENIVKTNELSIHHQDLSRYYSLPIADCVYSKSSFLVRILVPVAKKLREESLQLIEIQPVPFRFKNQICQLQLNDLSREDLVSKSYKGRSTQFFLYAELSGRFFPTECRSNELCQINENEIERLLSEHGAHRNSVSTCLYNLQRNRRNVTEFFRVCPFKCTSMEGQDKAIVTRLTSNKYVYTPGMNSTNSARVECEKDRRNFPIRQADIGAIQITLPCSCKLIVGENAFYSRGMKCGKDETDQVPTIFPAIPYHFVQPSKRSLIELQDENTLFDFKTVIDGSAIKDKYVDNDEGREIVREEDLNANKVYTQEYSSGTDDRVEERIENSSLVALWIVFAVTAIFLFAVQVYIIVLFKKQQKVNDYPKNPILYQVPDSPKG